MYSGFFTKTPLLFLITREGAEVLLQIPSLIKKRGTSWCSTIVFDFMLPEFLALFNIARKLFFIDTFLCLLAIVARRSPNDVLEFVDLGELLILKLTQKIRHGVVAPSGA